MAFLDDFTIDYSGKTISHTSWTTIYTLNEMYSAIQDQFDELTEMDDTVPMSAQTPTEYSLINGWTLWTPATDIQFLKSGALTDTSDDTVWANIYTLGAMDSWATVYIEQNGSVLTGFWGTGHIDILVMVKNAGTYIDSWDLILYAREYGYLFDHFTTTVTGWRNAIPLATAADWNNQTAEWTVSWYTDISITRWAVTKDLNNGAGLQPYDAVIDCAGRPLAEMYEYLKYVTRSWETDLQDGVEGQIYRKADGSYTAVKVAPFGTFAWWTYFGARGIWIENFDVNDAKSFQLIDWDWDTQAPPNTVVIQVTGVVAGDRVTVFKTSGWEVFKEQYDAAAWNDSGDGTVVITGAIDSDTPSAGTVIIDGDAYAYTSWTGSTFTLSGTLSKNYSLNDDTYVPYIYEEATSTTANNSLIYSSDVPVICRVRKKGILPFETTGSITNTGYSASAIRTSDNIVT